MDKFGGWIFKNSAASVNDQAALTTTPNPFNSLFDKVGGIEEAHLLKKLRVLMTSVGYVFLYLIFFVPEVADRIHVSAKVVHNKSKLSEDDS